jgi:hypothetical protein
MSQSPKQSIKEAGYNIVFGFVLNYIANLIILPLTDGIRPLALRCFIIGLWFTIVSITRQYIIRRWRVRKGE